MNNREIASPVWLGVFLAWGLTRPDVRAAGWQVIKAFVQPKVIGPVVALAAWTAGLAALACQVGLWKPDLLSDTIVWFATVGVASYFSLQSVGESGYFRRTLKRAAGVAVFVEVFVNLRVFSLPVELAVLLFATVLAMVEAVSRGKDDLRIVHRLVSGVLSVLGFVFVVHVAASLLDDPKTDETVRKLLLPVWLTLGAMPLIYMVGLWSAYESAFTRINLRTNDPDRRRWAKRALMRVAHIRASEVAGFAGHWSYDLTNADSARDARQLAERYRACWRSERHDERMRDARAFMATG